MGDFVTFDKGKAPKETFESPGDRRVPYLSPEYLRGDAAPLYVVPTDRDVMVAENDPIILWDGSNAGEIFCAKPGVLASTMTRTLPKNNEVQRSYLGHALKYHEGYLKALTAGSGIPHVDKAIVKRLLFWKPDPNEQEAVSTAISLVDLAIAAVRDSITKAERLQKGLMQQLLTGRLKPDGSARTKSEFKVNDHFGQLPKGWQSARVKQLISRCEYGLSRAMSEQGQYPIFRMNNIKRGRMIAAPLAYIDLSPEDFARYRVRKGDILINRTNTVELVGKVGIFALEGDFVFASYLVRLVANDENDPRFLNYYLNSFEGQKRIAAKVTPSIGQANINTSSLKSVWAVKPPRDEQTAIADRLDAFFELITAKEQKISALQRLKKSLMQNLLTGRIRLPVNGAGKEAKS